LSAMATPVTNKNAVANKNTFFMIIFFELINVKIRQKLQPANSQLLIFKSGDYRNTTFYSLV
jgi:hypothetical protein